MFLTEAIQPHSPFLTSFLVVKIILKTRALLGALAGTEGLQMFIKQGGFLPFVVIRVSHSDTLGLTRI